MTYYALTQILGALQNHDLELRVMNCPKTVGALSRSGIVILLRTTRKRDHVWKHRGPEMNDGKVTNYGYTALVTRGPNFSAGLNGISALLAALPARHDPCDRSYCY